MTFVLREIVQTAVTRTLVEKFERRPYFPLDISGSAAIAAPRAEVLVGAEPGNNDGEDSPITIPLRVSIRGNGEGEERVLHNLLELVASCHGNDFDCAPYVVLDITFDSARFSRGNEGGICYAEADFILSCVHDS